MPHEDVLLTVVFEKSGESRRVSLARLVIDLTYFFDCFGEKSLVGERFHQIIGAGDGRIRLARLLGAAKYPDDPKGFFSDLLGQLGAADGTKKISVNGIDLPHRMLVSVLETVLPGNRFVSVKTTEQLERLTNKGVAKADRGAMQEVLDTYPVRLSMHTIRQMRVSSDVAYQYLPFTEELDTTGHTNTWIGQFHQGLLEQMYQNRVIFLLNMSCPVYCRFCFRKHKESRNQSNPTADDVATAVAHVRASPAIKEIVITGGDPFMNRANMACAIDGLMAIEHVQTLRLATRSIAYYPHLFLGDDGAYLNYLKRKNLELQDRGKRMEVATHFIHPDEISPQSLSIITDLVNSGIAVYVQTPFLNGCNDTGPELAALFGLLRGAGAELHYIYIPCSPIHGNSVYWSPISKGLAAGRYLRAHLSDRVMPRICTATPIGKMDWHTSGWAVEPDKDNDHFIWIRTPYTPDYFKAFAPLAAGMDNVRVNEEGTIDIQYMARIGDEGLFLGARPPKSGTASVREQPGAPSVRERPDTETLSAEVLTDQRLFRSIVSTGSPAIRRVHETRVEIDADADGAALDYIAGDLRITDVVVAARTDAVENLFYIDRTVKALQGMPHVNAVRLRSLLFNYKPERFSSGVIEKLAGLNRLTPVNPLRLEIETQFFCAEEIRPEHGNLVRRLNNHGITVYCNTPLLGGVNDNANAIHRLAYACRRAGIEFHHLYVAGLPLQRSWNADRPVLLDDVIDIATRVRREGSGREVPRYIIATCLGEVDFGLTSTLSADGGRVSVTLLPYDLAYFRALDADFEWPEPVTCNNAGQPVVPLTGLSKRTGFALC